MATVLPSSPIERPSPAEQSAPTDRPSPRPGTFFDRDWRWLEGRVFLAWGIFNPDGPTLNCVGICRQRGIPGAQVFHRSLHFTGSKTTILGKIRPDADEWDETVRILQEAFAVTDGGAATNPTPLVTAIPTFVVSNLPDAWEGLQWELLASTLGGLDWGAELDLVRRHGRDLFGRAGEELWREVHRLRAQDPDSMEAKFVASRCVAVADPVGPDVPPFSSAPRPSAPWDAELFDAWRGVVGHPDWVDHAIMETAHAWVGAIHLAHEGLVRWHPFEALQDFFAACGFPLFGDAEEEAPMTSAWLARGIGVPTPPEPRHFGPGTLFPLDDVLGYLAGAMGARQAHVIMADNGFGWPGAGRTTVGIRVEPVGLGTEDGFRIQEEAICIARAPWLDGLGDAEVAELNQLAGVAGLVHHPQSGKLALTSKAGIFEGDEAAAERIYASILAPWSLAAEWTLERLRMGGGPVDPADVPFPFADDPPPVAPHEWHHALEVAIRSQGFMGSVGPSGLTAEFPWDEGAWTRMVNVPETRKHLLDAGTVTREDLRRLGGRTSLLQVSTHHRHALFGRGIGATLQIPVCVEGDEAVQLVKELNAWELETPDLPPYFGAWVPGPHGPMFLTFVPTHLCVPGLIMNLATWARGRAGAVRRWMGVGAPR